MPVQLWSPASGSFGPLDQNDRALAAHVIEAKVARVVGLAQAIAVDVVDGGFAGVVVMDQRVGGTRGAGAGAEPAADRLHEGRLAGAQLPRQADHGRRAQPRA